MIRAVDISPVPLHEALSNKIWRSYDKKQFTELKKSLKLPEYLFIEIFLDWTEHAKSTNSDIIEVWRELDLQNTSQVQITYLRKFVMSKFSVPLLAPPTKNNLLTVCYKCNIELVQQLRNGKYASFTFPLKNQPGLNPTLTFKLRLTVDRDPVTGVSYETERSAVEFDMVSHRVVHWFIIGLESFSFWHIFEKTVKGPVFMSLIVNDFEAMCSVLQACSRNLEVYALLEETE